MKKAVKLMEIPFIDIHTHKRSEALCVVSYGLGREPMPENPAGPFSGGIHPWDADGMPEKDAARYLGYLSRAPISAVGECGLDYLRGGDPDKQKAIFSAQIEIASRRSLPVIVHCVKAYNDLFKVIGESDKATFILHGYIGSIEQTRTALDHGCFISVGAGSLRSPKTVESLGSVPMERLFAETDESRSGIEEIYAELADVKGVGIEELAGRLRANLEEVFKDHTLYI